MLKKRGGETAGGPRWDKRNCIRIRQKKKNGKGGRKKREIGKAQNRGFTSTETIGSRVGQKTSAEGDNVKQGDAGLIGKSLSETEGGGGNGETVKSYWGWGCCVLTVGGKHNAFQKKVKGSQKEPKNGGRGGTSAGYEKETQGTGMLAWGALPYVVGEEWEKSRHKQQR